ncbi:unnamed protein product [Ilex paraguariensis]|uniref:TmcB/TmcC TPR repeats domain-containing protein n=1 Tax=Ilex paraguariensis TaxID=185542 RepID=A0ABC8U3I1_9AQUA
MKAVLVRTGSVPVLSSFVCGSPRVSLSVHDSISGEKSHVSSPKIGLRLEVNRRSVMRRALSETDVVRLESEASDKFSKLSGIGSLSFPGKIPEEEYVESEDEVVFRGIGSLTLTGRDFDRRNYKEDWPASAIPVEELGFPGVGGGKNRNSGGRGDSDCELGTGGGNSDQSKIGAYYQELLKSNPTNPLLLRNYGKYLHEVEKDTAKAEEYYGRAILASPGDGEVLSLYGKLIWETQRDEDRAKSYFDQAVHASPDDCTVLGSYAHFMWEAEEEEDEDEDAEEIERKGEQSATMVGAF